MGISIWQLLIILAIVLVLFGAKRLRNLGADLGASVKGFKDSMKEGEESKKAEDAKQLKDGEVIEGEVHQRENTRDKV